MHLALIPARCPAIAREWAWDIPPVPLSARPPRPPRQPPWPPPRRDGGLLGPRVNRRGWILATVLFIAGLSLGVMGGGIYAATFAAAQTPDTKKGAPELPPAPIPSSSSPGRVRAVRLCLGLRHGGAQVSAVPNPAVGTVCA
jgi:hypothetical protein